MKWPAKKLRLDRCVEKVFFVFVVVAVIELVFVFVVFIFIAAPCCCCFYSLRLHDIALI